MSWEFMKVGDDNHLYDEEGNCRDITTHDYVIPFGKYKGLEVYEVSDVSYLTYLKQSNDGKKPTDWYMNKIISMRLKELS